MKRICRALLLTICLFFSTSYGNHLERIEGRCLVIDSEPPQYLIFIEGLPCVITDCSENINSELYLATDGDLIEIEWDGTISESYPGRVNAFGCRVIEKGSLTDLDETLIARLKELGWSVAE